MVKAILLKPLDGDPEGSVREFDRTDFDALERMGAVRAAPDDDALRNDGPTVAEFVAAGYSEKIYPPQGYASRSTPDEIAAAVALQDAPPTPALSAPEGAAKAAPAVANKAAPPVANKAAAAPAAKATDRA